MPDEAPAAPAEPNAAQPTTPPAVRESLAQQFERIAEGAGGLSDDKSRAEPDPSGEVEKSEPEQGEEGKTKPDAKKPRKKTVEPDKPPPNELEAFRQQATRFGFVVEDGRVTTKERAEFRAAHRSQAEQRAREEQALMQRIEAAKQEASGSLERVQKFESAVEAGDFEGIATSLGFKATPAEGDKPGRSAWDALIQDQIDRNADPNYKRLRKLEQEHQERAERDARAAQAEQERQAQAQQARARAEYHQNLTAQMKGSQDSFVAAFHDVPALVQAVFAIQMQEFQAGNPIPTPEQAVRMRLNGIQQTPREWIEDWYKRSTPVFGSPAAPTPAPAPNPQAKPAPKTVTVPKPAPARRAKWQNDQAERMDMIRRMAEAARADEQEFRRTGRYPT